MDKEKLVEFCKKCQRRTMELWMKDASVDETAKEFKKIEKEMFGRELTEKEKEFVLAYPITEFASPETGRMH